MNSDHEIKTGGASITPSARPSIHSHSGGCQFSLGERINMGKYGLQDKATQEKLRANNQTTDTGMDEVDNALSKFSRGSSPVAARVAKYINQKRNSFDGNPTYTEDSDCSSRMIARSYDSYFEARFSRFSDEFGNWPPSTQVNQSNESTQSNRSWPNNDSSVASQYESSFNTTNRTQGTSSQKPIGLFMVILMALLAVLYAVYYGKIPTSIIPEVFTTSNTYNAEKLYDDLIDLGGRYKITDNNILQLQTGISTIFERQDTGSFVLAYRSSDSHFDFDIFNNLVNNIAATASKYLRNDSTSVQHIVVDGSKLEMRSHSELINRYRDEVTKTGVMLVREVDEVPSALAMAFHYYCDDLNPLVKRSAIFFTLDMAKCSHNPAEQNPTHAQIEKCLMNKWSGVPEDNISPLLNRVVSTVVNVAGDG